MLLFKLFCSKPSYRNLSVLQSIDLKPVVNMFKIKKIKQLSLMGVFFFFAFLFISIRQVHD